MGKTSGDGPGGDMKFRVFFAGLAVVLSFALSGGKAYGQQRDPKADARSATYYGLPEFAHGSYVSSGRVLLSFNGLPADSAYEVIGPISVYKRWYGGLSTARRMLADQARALGANAIVETRVWLAPAFPAKAAPHGSGIAIRVNHPDVLQSLMGDGSSWE
jgi:hypothetical protein